jgi:hypothetical protein
LYNIAITRNHNQNDPFRGERLYRTITHDKSPRASRGANGIKETISSILGWGKGTKVHGVELGKRTSLEATFQEKSIRVQWNGEIYPASISVHTGVDEIHAKLPARGPTSVRVNNLDVVQEDVHTWLEKAAAILEFFEAGLEDGEITPY